MTRGDQKKKRKWEKDDANRLENRIVSYRWETFRKSFCHLKFLIPPFAV